MLNKIINFLLVLIFTNCQICTATIIGTFKKSEMVKFFRYQDEKFDILTLKSDAKKIIGSQENLTLVPITKSEDYHLEADWFVICKEEGNFVALANIEKGFLLKQIVIDSKKLFKDSVISKVIYFSGDAGSGKYFGIGHDKEGSFIFNIDADCLFQEGFEWKFSRFAKNVFLQDIETDGEGNILVIGCNVDISGGGVIYEYNHEKQFWELIWAVASVKKLDTIIFDKVNKKWVAFGIHCRSKCIMTVIGQLLNNKISWYNKKIFFHQNGLVGKNSFFEQQSHRLYSSVDASVYYDAINSSKICLKIKSVACDYSSYGYFSPPKNEDTFYFIGSYDFTEQIFKGRIIDCSNFNCSCVTSKSMMFFNSMSSLKVSTVQKMIHIDD